MGSESPGTLFVVATPIGNLGDLSPRAIDTLRSVDLIACEDTRRTGRLLAGLGLDKRLLSFHEHNEEARIDRLIAELATGNDVALVSDAGTPLVADPGYPLVRSALRQGHRVIAIPGASSVLAALVSSGLPPYPFTFLGYPPPKSGKRRNFFGRFAGLGHTLVFFEAPHRIIASLEDAEEILGERDAAVSRELTKMHEETLRGNLGEVRRQLEKRERIRGELVVVVGKAYG
jgi:16S rRNA (cytidine1402-2'-O)-methyltransferase